MAWCNMTSSIDHREVPPKIVKWAGLERTVRALLNNFKAWEQRNAELINKFFNQNYFRGNGLLTKLIEIDPNIKFDDISKEWINLAVLLYSDWMWDFNDCMNQISNNEIKTSLITEIHHKVESQIWAPAIPYDDFYSECPLPGNDDVAWYFQKVVDYLDKKAWDGRGAKKTIEILKKINITNEDLNNNLPAWLKFPLWVKISDPTVPANTKKDFDTLLSFEIWKEASRTINIAKHFSKSLEWLLTNSIPAINTVVWESNEYKYDESTISNKYPEYQWRIQTITNDSSLSEAEKNKQIKGLKREFYLKYLKTKNLKIWNALEQLYNNDFDYSKVASSNPTILKDYFDAVADIRLNMLFDNWMNKFINIGRWNHDEFKAFYKELTNFDPSNPNLTLSNVTISWSTPPTTWSVVLPIHKKIKEWPNNWLKDIDEFWKNAGKSYDAFPMEFTINKSDIESMNITIEDKTKLLNFLARFDQWDKYEIKWEDIWMLIYLFFVINSRFPITEFDSEQQKNIENLFWQAKNHKNAPENQGDNEDNKPNEDNEPSEEFTPANFKEEMGKLWADWEEDCELWMPAWKSDLPGWWYQWMKIKISEIDMTAWTFVGTIYWWELKFNEKLEWKSRKYKMNKETLEELRKAAKTTSGSDDKLWLLPNPNKSDFNSYINSLNNKLWTSSCSFPVSWVTWNGKKFMKKIVDKKWNEKEVEVKHFWASWDDTSTYKIEYNPSRRCFTVSSSFNWKEKWKDWKTDTKRFSYKRDMDWSNFLIFYTQKWLYPQSEKEANDAIIRQDEEFKVLNGWHWKLNWFSLSNIKNWFKAIFSNLKKKLDDYNKRKDEDVRKIFQRHVLTCLGAIPILPPSLKDAIWNYRQDVYNEEFNEAWPEIERYLKALQSDDQFADTFDQVPPHVQLLYWTSYKEFIINLFEKKWETSTEEKRKSAALLLANLQKWWAPYRWLPKKENSGLWVKVILGTAHYEQFLRDKQNCINDLKNAWWEKDQLEDVLATCEMDYIMNNINWSNWKLNYFGSHEKRWIPWKNGTDYIPNASKRLLSEKFSKELKTAYKWWFDKDAVESSLSEIKHNDFNLAREDFKRFIKSGRFPQAISNLEKMFTLADNDEQKADYQKCFLIYMLSGILDFNGKKDLRKQAYEWAKTMCFLPGMLAKNVWHSQQVVMLLDDFCQEKRYPKFSESVKSYFHEWDLKQWETNIENLINDLDKVWIWNENTMKDFRDYTAYTFPSKKFPKDSILDKLQKDALNSGMQNINNSLLENDIVANSGWLLSNANVVRDRMLVKDGEFEWKEPKEKDNRKKFWDQITVEVNKTPLTVDNTKLLLKQYCDRFQIHDMEKMYRRIKTAYERKELIGKVALYQNDEGNWDNMGIISDKEIRTILWYTFQWTVMSECFSGHRLPEALKNALKAFQNKFEAAFALWLLNDPTIVSERFGIWNESNIKPLFLWSWDQYNKTVTGRENSGDDDDKKEKNRVKRHFMSWNFINYDIATLEKRLKNLPTWDYVQVTTGDLDALYNRFRAAEAA